MAVYDIPPGIVTPMKSPELPDHLSPLSELVHSFDHFAFAVRDLGSSTSFFQSFGGKFLREGDNRRMGFRWIQFVLPGDTKVEAISPVTDDCFLHDFLRSRGDGIHHITFRVTDLAAAAARAEAAGLQVVGLFTDLNTWKECFIHPNSAHGTVVQLAEWVDKDKLPPTFEGRARSGIFSVV